jgi:PAS domain S-box-containing protein
MQHRQQAPQFSGLARPLPQNSLDMEALEPFPQTWFARIAGALGFLTGLAVLLGWMLGVPWLTSVLPGWPKMASLTALGITLASASLWLMATARAFALDVTGARRARAVAVVARSFATLVMCIGVVGLMTRLAGWNLRLEALTMERLSVTGISPAGSIATATALSLFLLGGALHLVQRWRWRQPYQVCALLVLVIGGLGFSRFAYGGDPLLPYAAMAIHSSAILLLLGAGTLSLRRDFGLMALLTSPYAGGASLRMLLPVIVLVPLGAGGVILGVGGGGSREAMVSTFALCNVVLLALAVWFSAALLERTDLARREAQRAFGASKERLRLIIEGALDAVISIDTAGLITGWNARAEAMFGWRAQEAIGRDLAELIIPEGARAAHREGLRRYLRGGHARLLNRRAELQSVRRDQQEFPIELALIAIQTEEGISFSAFVRDITEQRATLQALKTGEANLREQLGRLQLLDTTTRAIRERQDLRSVFQVVLRSLEESPAVDFGCVCLYEGASPLLSVSCLGPQSQVLAAELTLSEQARIYIDQHDWSRCIRGEFVYDPDTSASASPFCIRLARAGLRSVIFAPLLVENSVFGILIVARRQADAFSSAECEFLRQLSGHVALAGNQAQLYSALQRAYEDLRHNQQAMLQQERLRAIGQLASGIAHDINNTLSPAGLYVQSMLERETQLSERSRRHLEVVRRAIENVSDTVARMRTFHQADEPLLLPEPVDANEALQQVVELTRARWTDMAHQRGITIQLQLETAAELPKVAVAASELRDALTNLVLNAVDAMSAGGTLTLRTCRIERPGSGSTSKSEVCLEVADTGVGMDEQQRKRCLEPFYTTKGERGSGLGLSMVYGMVQRYGAQLQIDSEPGSGTTMRLIFPVVAFGAATQTVIAPPQPKSLRILLVDDDPLILDSLSSALIGDGHQLVAVDGGRAGIDSFASAERSGQPFAIVITDLGMPHVDGRKVAAAIKAVAPRTPVIMLTGWGHQMNADDDRPEHVDRILSKPPRLVELRTALAELAR